MPAQTTEKQQYWGYLIIGVVAICAGIVMFLKVVPGRYPENAAPREMQMVFTQMFSRQAILKQNNGKFSSDFNELMITKEDCAQFDCKLSVDKDGNGYQFLLTMNGRSWFIQASSPVPKELKTNGEIAPAQNI